MSDSGGVFKVEPVEFAVGLGVGCVVAGRARKPGVFCRLFSSFSCSVMSDCWRPHGLRASLPFTVSRSRGT